MKEDLKLILRKSGYKATNQRLAILAVFKKSRKPLSAQDIISEFPKNIDQATVYRTLSSLKEKGLIKPIDLRHNHAYYELVELRDHHHIICLRCGKIEDTEHEDVEEMENAILHRSKHFAKIEQHTLEFYGICKACVRSERISSLKI